MLNYRESLANIRAESRPVSTHRLQCTCDFALAICQIKTVNNERWVCDT